MARQFRGLVPPPEVGYRNYDQQSRDAQGGEDIEQGCLLEINQQENQDRQTENPQVGEPASLLSLRSYSLTHAGLSLARKQMKGWL